jgi:hypothetical protein
VSLHTIVTSGFVGRPHARRAGAATAGATAVVQPRASDVTALLSGYSMRFLETGLAVIAIATALLIGLGR